MHKHVIKFHLENSKQVHWKAFRKNLRYKDVRRFLDISVLMVILVLDIAYGGTSFPYYT